MRRRTRSLQRATANHRGSALGRDAIEWVRYLTFENHNSSPQFGQREILIEFETPKRRLKPCGRRPAGRLLSIAESVELSKFERNPGARLAIGGGFALVSKVADHRTARIGRIVTDKSGDSPRR